MTALWLAAIYLGLLAIKLAGAWATLRQHEGTDKSTVRSGAGREGLPQPSRTVAVQSDVAVFQPILSGDPALADVLQTALQQLPAAQFWWLVDTDDAQAQAVTARLLASHPEHRIVIRQCEQAPEGVNPKSFKLDIALRESDAPICLVLDDDAWLTADALATLLRDLDRGELATALPYYRDAQSFMGRLLAQFTNNNAALAYLPLSTVLPPVSINGMCYVFRRQTLSSLGGFSALWRHLADDLAVADAVRAAGGRLVQSLAPVQVGTTVASSAAYIRQMHRWMLFATLLLRRRPPAMRALIVVLHGLHPLLLWGVMLCAAIAPTAQALVLAVALLALRAAAIIGLQHRLTGASRHRPLLSILSELLQPLHLLHACTNRTIRWRSRVYRVHDNDRFDGH